MTKAIFTTRVTPAYDDLPEQRYHFPRTYLNQVREAVGDDIIYYEPGRIDAAGNARGGRQAYFALAHVDGVIDDDKLPGHYYALISNFLSFDRSVPFARGDHYFEGALRKDDGTTNRGAFGRAVRLIPDTEFTAILAEGFAPELTAGEGGRTDAGLAEPPALFERPIVEQTVARPFRDRLFQKVVREAYRNSCALTGLKLINGGGRPEVQAAHIIPIAADGPDSVRNGLALSGTMHWLFDRGLVSVDDNYRILFARDKIPDPLAGLFNPSGKIALPADPTDWPHPFFLKYHRENIFKSS